MEPLKALMVIRKPSICPRAKPASADRSITVRSDASIYIIRDINAQTYWQQTGWVKYEQAANVLI